MNRKISRPQIREVFLRNGFAIAPDRDDLPDWVYESTFELLEIAAAPPVSSTVAGRTYLSGPMTGLPDFNFPAFNSAATVLRGEGLDVINPAEHGVIDGWGWADYLRHDISLLATCDQIVLLPGWSQSKGARLELHIAQQLGMRVHLYGGAEWFGPGAVMPEVYQTAEVCDD